MVREPDAAMQPAPQGDQLMSKHRVLGFKPQLRLEWRGQDSKNETEQPDHSVNLRDSITASTRTRFSVHTGRMIGKPRQNVGQPGVPISRKAVKVIDPKPRYGLLSQM